MYYSPERFGKLDEAHAIADSLRELSPRLYETLNAARADLLDRYPSDLFWENQNNANMPRLINQRCARIWDDDRWELSDKCGYLHLTESASGMRAILRRVDPITGGLPKTNATKASRAYYMQSTCKRSRGAEGTRPGQPVRAGGRGLARSERHQTDSGLAGNRSDHFGHGVPPAERRSIRVHRLRTKVRLQPGPAR